MDRCVMRISLSVWNGKKKASSVEVAVPIDGDVLFNRLFYPGAQKTKSNIDLLPETERIINRVRWNWQQGGGGGGVGAGRRRLRYNQDSILYRRRWSDIDRCRCIDYIETLQPNRASDLNQQRWTISAGKGRKPKRGVCMWCFIPSP